ncbi:MAG TPA: family 16 glycoside hydrolase, partial [Anaerolineales bacterium]|nr:family 16 glycoside hydrolase [Anaerolineales bacterium]
YRKSFFIGVISLLWVVFAAGCGGNAPPAVATDEIYLDTLVAEAVETNRAAAGASDAQNAANAALLTEAAGEVQVLQAQTLTPSITPTADAAQTQAAAETMAAQVTPDDSTPVGTPLATLPPLNLPTPTLPAVPTRQPGDPAAGLGNFDWQDAFDSSENWSEYTTSHAQVEVSSGELHYTVFAPASGPAWTVSWPSVSNFYLEVLVRTPQTCSGKDRFGLVFRAADPSQGYRYELSCDGQYHMMQFDPNGAETVVAWASSDALLAGPNQINRIGVWAQGKVVSLVINGVVVAGVPETDFRTGRFGFVVASENTENLTVSFDDLTFWTFE